MLLELEEILDNFTLPITTQCLATDKETVVQKDLSAWWQLYVQRVAVLELESRCSGLQFVTLLQPVQL